MQKFKPMEVYMLTLEKKKIIEKRHKADVTAFMTLLM